MATPNLCPVLCRVLWAAALEQSGPHESSHEPPLCRATTSTLDVPAFFWPTNSFTHISQKSRMFPATGQKEISTQLWQPLTASVPSARGRGSLFASPSPATFFPKLYGAKSWMSNWFSKPSQPPVRHAAASQPPAANTHLLFSLLQNVHPFVLFFWREPGDTGEMGPSPVPWLLSQLRLFFSVTKRCSQVIFLWLLILPAAFQRTADSSVSFSYRTAQNWRQRQTQTSPLPTKAE